MLLGEADTRFVVSAAAPQSEGGASLPVSSALPPADAVKRAGGRGRGPGDAGRDAVVLLFLGPGPAGACSRVKVRVVYICWLNGLYDYDL